jgi:hypothetical protein
MPGGLSEGPVSEGMIWVARTLDWLLVLGFAVFWFGVAALFGDDVSFLVGVGILTAIFGSMLCVVVQGWTLASAGISGALFLLGLRALPGRFQEGLDWFFGYWLDVLLSPLDWLRSRRGDRPTGIVRDPRSTLFGARCARLLLGLLALASPLPLVLALTG